MYRPVMPPAPGHSVRLKEACSRLLAPLTLWICVSVGIRYGYFSDQHMVLGPSSSRLMKANSVFIEQVEVRNDDDKEIILYGFSEKPELSFKKNWSASDYFAIAPYSRQGFYFWLNKDSRISMKWNCHSSLLNELQLVLIKGEKNYETLLPTFRTSPDAPNIDTLFDGKEAEYIVKESDKYYLALVNTNSKSIIVKIELNVTSKLYDLSKARNMCSSINGSCRLMLPFPETRFVVVTTPHNADLRGWYIEISFIARVITYIAILGFVIIVVFLVLKYLGACDNENRSTTTVETTTRPFQVSETQPILHQKPIGYTYGTNEDDNDDDRSSSSSSEDLYDAKLCVICYDEQRNCFFVPCGHCATCYDCARRIIEGESKMCPICRRLIHKVRRLFNS